MQGLEKKLASRHEISRTIEAQDSHRKPQASNFDRPRRCHRQMTPSRPSDYDYPCLINSNAFASCDGLQAPILYPYISIVDVLDRPIDEVDLGR